MSEHAYIVNWMDEDEGGNTRDYWEVRMSLKAAQELLEHQQAIGAEFAFISIPTQCIESYVQAKE